MNDNGHRTKSGALFTKQSVQYIAQNPIYTGRLTYNKQNARKKKTRILLQPYSEVVVEDAFPAIIDKEKFENAQRIIANRTYVTYDNKDYIYLLTGLIHCSDCSRTLVGGSNAGGRDRVNRHYYHCPTHRIKHCSTKSINADYLENVVLDIVITMLNGYLANHSADKLLRDRIREIDSVITRLKTELSRVESKYNNCLNAIALLANDTCLLEHTAGQMRECLSLMEDLNAKIAMNTTKKDEFKSLIGKPLVVSKDSLLKDRIRARSLCQLFIKGITVSEDDNIIIDTI